MDAYWAKDIMELFRLEKRAAFQRLFELMLVQSGGIFDASRFARDCGVSRTTIANYLAVLEATSVAHVVRPYSAGGSTEIVAAPRVFGFDTGFVCYYRGWNALRPDDVGILLEHLFLNEVHAHGAPFGVHYWRDKAHHEIDFVLLRRGGDPSRSSASAPRRPSTPRTWPRSDDGMRAAPTGWSSPRERGPGRPRFAGWTSKWSPWARSRGCCRPKREAAATTTGPKRSRANAEFMQ